MKRFFSCTFDIESLGEDLLVYKTSDDPVAPSNIIWSHLIPKSELSSIDQPKYPVHLVAKIKNARVNLRGGLVFDENGKFTQQIFVPFGKLNNSIIK
jgi:hypothetical protein